MKILIGLDGSPGSHNALRWVAEHGPALDAQIIAALVVPRSEIWELASVQIDSGPALARRRAHLEGDWTDPLRAVGLRVTTRLLRGEPGAQLCKLAETRAADLLVIGAKSHSAVPHLLGGTAHKVANHARCPVLLVTAPDRKKR
ncbi:MAG: universal stress protein [Acidimicrobiales bacterium]